MLAATAVSIQADVIFAFIAFVATNLFVEAFEFASYHLQKEIRLHCYQIQKNIRLTDLIRMIIHHGLILMTKTAI